MDKKKKVDEDVDDYYVFSSPTWNFQSSTLKQWDRLEDVLLFGQLFKACGNNYFAQNSQKVSIANIIHIKCEILPNQVTPSVTIKQCDQ